MTTTATTPNDSDIPTITDIHAAVCSMVLNADAVFGLANSMAAAAEIVESSFPGLDAGPHQGLCWAVQELVDKIRELETMVGANLDAEP